jgi:hypothetical protein
VGETWHNVEAKAAIGAAVVFLHEGGFRSDQALGSTWSKKGDEWLEELASAPSKVRALFKHPALASLHRSVLADAPLLPS